MGDQSKSAECQTRWPRHQIRWPRANGQVLGYLHSANIEIGYQLEFSGCCTGTSTVMILCQREMRSLAFFFRFMQNIWRTLETCESWKGTDYIWHCSTLWFYRSTDWLVLFGVSSRCFNIFWSGLTQIMQLKCDVSVFPDLYNIRLSFTNVWST